MMALATTTPTSDSRRALGLSTLAFTLCFAVWTLFSIVGLQVRQEFGLSDTQFGLLLATPALSGSLARLPLGVWADRYGGRWLFGLLMLLVAACVALLSRADSYAALLGAALGLGLAGGAFIVGVTYVSTWFDADRQGRALSLFGVGNVGAALTAVGAPLLFLVMDWRDVALVYAAVIAAAGLAFMLLSKTDPAAARLADRPACLQQRLAPLAELRVWRFSLYYFFVFGAFVALAVWLPYYLVEVYGLSVAAAGVLAAFYIVAASLFRPLGARLSDRYGARRVMYWTLGASVVCTFCLSYPPTEYTIAGTHGPIHFSLAPHLAGFVLLTVVLGVAMAIGRAAVFKHTVVYYPRHVGVVGGAVGMIGGLGGFLLPLTFGMLNDVIGIWQSAFMLLFLVAAAALAWMHFAILRASRQEWAAGRDVRDLPELATPSAFVLADWQPEDEAFWVASGRRIARRNLMISIPCLVLAFAVWMVWSVVVAELPKVGFRYSANQLFWLAALPGLSGATLRIFYSFLVPIFGGRRFTAVTTASLLLPALWIGFAVQNPDTPYLAMLIVALLCGLGGGNFASSMANISFFFPRAEKGRALGLNAGLGNLGVSLMQFVVPLVVATGAFAVVAGGPQTTGAGEPRWLQNAGFVWVPLIVVASLAAWFGMNDIASVKSSFKDQSAIFKRKHTWLMCLLYTGTFGSFIGFSAGFPLLAGDLFPKVNVLPLVFLGPLLGALSRAFSGGLADRYGGARVSLWVFVVMAAGVVGVLFFLGIRDWAGAFWGFFAMFLLLFTVSGIGNASTTQMIPAIFRRDVPRLLPHLGTSERNVTIERESAAAVGFTAAIAAYGAFFIPKAFGSSIAVTGGPQAALYGFIGFYLVCVAVTWFFYTRRNAPTRLHGGPVEAPDPAAGGYRRAGEPEPAQR